jgi:ABC-type multidrug transport system fused ATPase/permease subunit
MFSNLKKIPGLLSKKEQRQVLLLLTMILIMAFLDTLGVASIMPFMAVLSDPSSIETNRYLQLAYTTLGFGHPQDFVFFLGLAIFFLVVISTIFKLITTWSLLRFTHMRNYSIGQRLVAGYLHQPYEWFLNRHSADLGKTVLTEVGHVINGTLIPLMNFIAQGAVVIAFLIMLVVMDPKLSLYVGLALSLSYIGIYLALQKKLAALGKLRVSTNQQRFEVVAEAFGGIKEVKVAGLEEAFMQRFNQPAKQYANTQAKAQVIAQVPRYMLEVLAFGGIMLVALYLMHSGENFQNALPLLALYAFAGYRLMPAMQSSYASLTQLRFSSPALASLHAEISNLAPATRQPCLMNSIVLEHNIRLENVSYTYPKAQHPSLQNLSLEIPAFTTVGLVGGTGAGKTTTVDIILGLLRPDQGQLMADGISIDEENLRAWQQVIGYVPQHIYLADDTVAANIAFGVEPEHINLQAVERAARIANLHDFIVNELPQGYATPVGERGVRLSGGQRQRIGIARALYHDPQILILDEATSALDNLTEQAVMEAVHQLGHKKTIILIAHRLSTVRTCDQIFLLEKGKLAGQGTFEQLLAENPRFRDMASVNE